MELKIKQHRELYDWLPIRKGAIVNILLQISKAFKVTAFIKVENSYIRFIFTVFLN